MDREQAVAECTRWLDYLDRQKKHSEAIMQIARDVRNGKCDDNEGRKRLRHLNRGPVVYDGARLADAVRILIK